ncbi:MAG: HAD family phosphatase [Acidobacteriota bacterium]|nr:HAD family phosphatase [Acidobacteriota bacterium]MDQ5836032.1 HAD family phosphatase [Acidobacteriota bacterium]
MTNTTDGRRAVLWDVDGTLIDSSEYHWLSWRDALAAESFPLTRERFAETFGQRNDEILRAYFPRRTPEDLARVGDAKEVRYRELIRERGITLLPGVRRWLDQLKRDGWLQAVASSAPRLNLDAIMSALGLEDYFAAVASAEDVTAGKPDPQVFLAAARKLSVAPSACVVVEDAPAGTEAARRAGMRSIGVLSSHAELRADIVVRTLEELPDNAFNELLAVKGKAEG